MYVKSVLGMVLVAGLALAVSCGSKKEDKTSSGSTETPLKSLGLSGVIDVKVPDSVSGKTTSLRLNTAKKSREACELRREVKEGLFQITEAGDMICRIENIPNLEFGKKYNIKFEFDGAGPSGTPPSGGPSEAPAALSAEGELPSIQVFVDNAKFDSDKTLDFYLCQNNTLTNMVRMKKNGDKSFGRFIMKGDIEGENGTEGGFHATAEFSTTGDDVVMLIKDKMTIGTGNTAEVAMRALYLDLKSDGISIVKSASSGTYQGETLNFRSSAKFGAEGGTVIQSFTDSVGSFNTQSYFDKDSAVVSSNPLPDRFTANKPYHLAKTSMPAMLPTNFSPDSFPATAWDCSGTEELTFKVTNEVISKCSQDGFEIPNQACDGTDFDRGDVVEFVDSDFSEIDSAGEEAAAINMD